MRRIPRASRSIDPSIPSQLVLRPRAFLSPRCTAPLLRTTSASFSTSTSYNSTASEDRKKHTTFVRKWQKRLIGDSEPIGSHVDPYDGSSPIRIRPEETGEEVELLEEQRAELQEKRESLPVTNQGRAKGRLYTEATDGRRLLKLGGDKWIHAQNEKQLLGRFNALLAHSGEGYGLVNPRFGTAGTPCRVTKDLNALFHRAIVEIFTLKELNLDPVIPNGRRDGVEITEGWTEQVQVHWSPETGVCLKNRDPSATIQFLKSIPPVSTREGDKAARIRAVRRMKKVIKLAKRRMEVAPTSTRSIQSKTTEQSPEIEGAVQGTKDKDAESTLQSIETAFSTVQNEVSTLRYKFLQSATRSSQKNVTKLSRELRDLIPLKAAKTERQDIPAYKHITLTDPRVQFAFKKRILQLTGHHIPDPTLYTSKTLSDLHRALFTLAFPPPTKVYANLKTVPATNKLSAAERALKRPVGRRAQSRLSQMQHVRILSRRIRPKDRGRSTGLSKVIKFALRERGLLRKQYRDRRLGRVVL